MEREPNSFEQEQPHALEVQFDHIPTHLQQYPQWVVWRYFVTKDTDGTRVTKKPPFSPKTGKRASVTDPSTWGSFAEARELYEAGGIDGVGFVLTKQLGVVGIDIDHCYAQGQFTEEAQAITTELNGYTEFSPSSTWSDGGIHIFVEGSLPGLYRRKGSIEMYEDVRYITLTGHRVSNTPQEIHQRQSELTKVYQRLFSGNSSQGVKTEKENTGWGDAHRADRRSVKPLPDDAVLQKAYRAKNGANFKRHYEGDYSLWEGAKAKHPSHSEADFELVLLLLYWSNGDRVQVDRLFRKSGLMREKWDRPIKGSETYGERIIKDALSKGNW